MFYAVAMFYVEAMFYAVAMFFIKAMFYVEAVFYIEAMGVFQPFSFLLLISLKFWVFRPFIFSACDSGIRTYDLTLI